MEAQPAYAQRLVGVVESHCAGTTVEDKTIRTLAAVVFKNLVKAKWTPEVCVCECVCVRFVLVKPKELVFTPPSLSYNNLLNVESTFLRFLGFLNPAPLHNIQGHSCLIIGTVV